MKKITLLAMVLVCMSTFAYSQCNGPIINDFTPKTGFIGSQVTISGANFETVDINDNIVYFGAVKADVVSANFGSLIVTVPVGATSTRITVTNNCSLTATSLVQFNGIFCPTPLTNTSYANQDFVLPVYGAYNMEAYDVDNDGDPEVISANFGRFTIAANNSTPGNLNFTRVDKNPGGSTSSIYFADFDGDGNKDFLFTSVLVPNESTGPGNYNTGTTVNHGTGRYQIAAGDFNGDGKPDIVGDNRIRLNTSTGPGNFSFGPPISVNTGSFFTGLETADVDGDGKIDIIGTSGGRNSLITVRNTTPAGSATLTFESPEFWSSNGNYPYRMKVADMDKDGKIDAVSPNYSSSTTAIWRNNSTPGNISFEAAITEGGPACNYRIGVGDVDGDGLADLVTKSLCQNVFYVYRNTSVSGTLSFDPAEVYTSSWQAEVSGIVIGDLDGDFVPDIATSGISSNRIVFHRNTSAQVDTQDPVAVCQNRTLPLSPQGSATLTPDYIDNGSSDECGIDFMTVSETNFDCNDVGDVVVTLTVTDNSGNEDTCLATVTVSAAEVTVTGQSTVCEGETVLLTASPADSWQWRKDGADISGETDQSYTASETGLYSVIVSNANGCGGESPGFQVVVNLNPTVDVTPSPALLCNGSVTLTASTSAIYQWKFNGTEIPGATLQTYTTTVLGSYSVEVIDIFGCNAVSDPVTVTTGESPTAVCNDITVDLVDQNTAYNLTAADVDNIAAGTTDNCPGYTYAITAGQTSYDCNDRDQGFSVTLTVTDSDNNIDECNATVSVEDPTSICNSPPVAVCQNITVNTGATCDASIVPGDVDGGSSDPDGDPLTYTLDQSGPFGVGLHTVVLSVSDAEYTETCNATVMVQDVTPPVAVCQDLTVSLDNSGNGSINASQVDNGSSDACGVSLSIDQSSFGCSNVGSNTVTLTVSDPNNNDADCTSNVNVQDNVNPDAVCQNIVVTLDAAGNASITPADVDGGSDDACGVASLSIDVNSFSCNLGDYDVELTVIDNNSNQSTCTAIVTIDGDDGDCDTVHDACDACDGGDDTVDNNNDGDPDCAYPPSFNDIIDAWKCGNNNKKVIVCHLPPGNPNNVQTLCISKNAVSAHVPLHGGDYLGPCNAVSCNSNNIVSEATVHALMSEFKEQAKLNLSNSGINISDEEMFIYPNPATGVINIEINSRLNSLDDLMIFDKIGQKVDLKLAMKVGDNAMSIDVSDWNKGVYMAVLQSEENMIIKRFIVIE